MAYAGRVRIGLGCMRLGDDARDVIRAAWDAGIRTFDTARAYGDNEAIVGEALRGKDARIVTKCGMRREGEDWIPDGRATRILEDVRKSVDALGCPIDLLLLHAPDPRTPLATSIRAMAQAVDAGAARAIGVSNVTRGMLEEAASLAPIAAVEVALGAYDDDAARGGVVAWCAERGIEVLAHSPLGGPKRAHKLAHDHVLRVIATRLGATTHEVVLAYLLAVSHAIVPLVGARNRTSVASAIRAASLVLDDDALAQLDARFPGLSLVRRPRAAPREARAEVVVLMGIAGAGKSRAVQAWTARGYERLNRDTLGGSLSGIARRLDALLKSGTRGVVLDNTYVTRASRSEVIRVAHENDASVRCVFLDTPPHEAQVNVATRMIERHGELLAGDALKRAAKRDPGMLGPGALFRMVRELEPPSIDEGFAVIDIVPFVRDRVVDGRPGLVVSTDAVAFVDPSQIPEGAPVLVFGWNTNPPDVSRFGSETTVAICTHAAGPPVCWCRPPLPGLFVAWARRLLIDPETSVMLGSGAAHRTMARTLGIRFAEVTR
jgi:aryl-alcohol dehydrogenase-like predicted oxidoreductase